MFVVLRSLKRRFRDSGFALIGFSDLLPEEYTDELKDQGCNLWAHVTRGIVSFGKPS